MNSKLQKYCGMILYKKFTLVLISISILAVLTGCAEFVSSKRLDMGPFGENTSAMINEVRAGLAIKRAILLKPYIQGETVILFVKQKEDSGKVLRGIIFYSTQIVNISRAKLTGPEKSKKLSEYIIRLASPLVEAEVPDIRISKERLDEIVEKIGAQPTFLDALGAAQPLVDAVDSYMTHSLEVMKELAVKIEAETSVRIDQHSAKIIENKNNLEALQSQAIKSFHLLNKLRAGDLAVMDALFQNDPVLKKYVKTGAPVGEKGMELMETNLMHRFKNCQTMLEKLKPRIDEYYAEIREMDELMYSFEQSARKMHLSVTLWARSHSNLAAGIQVPPEIDIGGIITGAASNVVKTAIP